MFHSAEVRWFTPGDLPSDVTRWFEKSGLAVREEPRVDEYLVLPGHASTGIKFRRYPGKKKSNFEIKACTSLEPETVSFPGDLDGVLETWVKWSVRPTDVQVFRESIVTGEDRWVFVEKQRILRKFSLDGDAPREVDSKSERPVEGCQFELTAIRAVASNGLADVDWDAADSWWSLSLESFGTRSRLRENLLAIDEALENSPRPDPEQTVSCPYSTWLQRA